MEEKDLVMEPAFKLIVERAEANATNQGDTDAEGGFTGNTRALGSSTLEEGDVFVIPANFKVKNSGRLSGTNGPVQYTFVNVLGNDGKVTAVKQLFPSAFQSTIRWYTRDEDGLVRSVGKSETSSGKPAEDFTSYKTVQEAMTALANRKIRVTKITRVQTRDYTDKEKLVDRNVYSFEYVA